MKRYIIMFIYLTLISCNRDSRKFTITDFSKMRTDTLQPYKWKIVSPIHNYSSAFVKLKGFSNDTIKLEGISNLVLIGNIDTIAKMDYYGTQEVICVFRPYKATEGRLEIEYGL